MTEFIGWFNWFALVGVLFIGCILGWRFYLYSVSQGVYMPVRGGIMPGFGGSWENGAAKEGLIAALIAAPIGFLIGVMF